METDLKPCSRSFAGLCLDRPRLLGIVNVTPDSFSDGGETPDPVTAIERGFTLAAAGADIIDVGGESTRPGAQPVPADVEQARVRPVVAELAGAGLTVSVDTRRAAVMAAAIDAGAVIVNDVTALTGDPAAIGIVANAGVSVILMHMQGEPQTMQADPRYGDPVVEISRWLAGRIAACEAAGIARERIAVDPGIGFGKTVAHNLDLLARLPRFRELGCAVAIGASRKSFIARVSRGEPAGERVAGSLAAALWAVFHGADLVRVHDVAATAQAIAVWQAIAGAVPADAVSTPMPYRQ